MKDIRVLLIDDHEMVRKGLIYFLESQEGFTVVGEADDGIEGVRLTSELLPDVVLVDLLMPGMDGLETIKLIKLKHPEIELIAVTSFIDDQKVHTALKNGASGYMMKDSNPAELARAIRAAVRGEVYLHPEATRRLAFGLRQDSEDAISPEVLTERELDVMRLIARGLSNQNIADDLFISLKTVKGHVSNILRKLNLQSRVQIALYALNNKIIPFEN